ncbi:adhesion G-protein coupled receptor G2-like [Pimephales promelas]|uniref:adhesion G-protein coupled receptor G2-like n=1 Tax=Pimephales promelas TaxID=90988 RepID=UPI0019557BFD|nr:adhesion G-protein coupled receptor G2-like [Pimephales promelas]
MVSTFHKTKSFTRTAATISVMFCVLTLNLAVTSVAQETTTIDSHPVDPCFNYNVLDNAWRATNRQSYIPMCDQSVSWSGWYRLFLYGFSVQIPDTCVEKYRCSTTVPLWIRGGHPKVEDGVVSRDVCGHWDNYCCYYGSFPIKVKACPGNYFVYELVRPTTCNFAYCADVSSINTSSTAVLPAPISTDFHSADPCYHYTVLDDPWRANSRQYYSYYNNYYYYNYNCNNYYKCDTNVIWSGWYRLFINGLNAHIPDTCVEKYSCGTEVPLWIHGGHPTVEDGVVTRDVCGHYNDYCCYYGSFPIKVKACPGNYYVYELVRPTYCCSTYCADTGSINTSSTTVTPVTIATVLSVDPCYNYTVLDDPRRATSYTYTSSMCDISVSWSGWYRLFYYGLNVQIPDTCVATYRCGTAAPLWIRGGHPTIEDGVVTRDVCSHWSNNCCIFGSFPIKIKACPGNYYVYELVSPTLCNSAYCADTGSIYNSSPAVTSASNSTAVNNISSTDTTVTPQNTSADHLLSVTSSTSTSPTTEVSLQPDTSTPTTSSTSTAVNNISSTETTVTPQNTSADHLLSVTSSTSTSPTTEVSLQPDTSTTSTSSTSTVSLLPVTSTPSSSSTSTDHLLSVTSSTSTSPTTEVSLQPDTSTPTTSSTSTAVNNISSTDTTVTPQNTSADHLLSVTSSTSTSPTTEVPLQPDTSTTSTSSTSTVPFQPVTSTTPTSSTSTDNLLSVTSTTSTSPTTEVSLLPVTSTPSTSSTSTDHLLSVTSSTSTSPTTDVSLQPDTSTTSTSSTSTVPFHLVTSATSTSSTSTDHLLTVTSTTSTSLTTEVPLQKDTSTTSTSSTSTVPLQSGTSITSIISTSVYLQKNTSATSTSSTSSVPLQPITSATSTSFTSTVYIQHVTSTTSVSPSTTDPLKLVVSTTSTSSTSTGLNFTLDGCRATGRCENLLEQIENITAEVLPLTDVTKILDVVLNFSERVLVSSSADPNKLVSDGNRLLKASEKLVSMLVKPTDTYANVSFTLDTLEVQVFMVGPNATLNKIPRLETKNSSVDIDLIGIAKNNSERSAAVAFMSYNTMENLLKPDFFNTSNDMVKTMMSTVISATLPKTTNSKLTKPVNFTLKHIRKLVPNGSLSCVYWNISEWIVDGCSVLETNSSYTVCSCVHLSTFALIMQTSRPSERDSLLELLKVLNLVCVPVGLVFFSLALLTFAICQWSPGVNNVARINLCISLLLAHLLFLLTQQFVSLINPHQVLCAVISGVLHFLFLSGFVWMLIEAVLLFICVKNLSQIRSSKRAVLSSRFLCVIGYVVGLVVVGVSAVVDPKGYGSEDCWIKMDKGFFWSFLGPVAVIIALNMILFINIIISLNLTLKNRNPEVSQMKQTKTMTFKTLAQFVVLGCSWILGFFTNGRKELEILFLILNSQQGTFIFLVYCVLNNEVRQQYRNWWRAVLPNRVSKNVQMRYETKAINPYKE